MAPAAKKTRAQTSKAPTNPPKGPQAATSGGAGAGSEHRPEVRAGFAPFDDNDGELYDVLVSFNKVLLEQAAIKRSIPEVEYAQTQHNLQRMVNKLQDQFDREDGRLLDRLDRAAADSLPDMAPAYNAVKGLADFCAKAAHEGGVVAGSGAGGAAGGGGGGGRGRKVQRWR